MTPDSTESALLADLERRLELARTDAVEFAERWNQVSNVRLVLAAIAVGLGFWWLRTGEDTWGLLALVALLGFIVVMIWHQRLRARRDWLDALVAVRARAIARVGRIWANLPQPAPTDIPLEHPFA
ncbi:MAG: hypothetical protein M3Y37_02340, partial [Chloroflexota bacterium]|nr:hypothetical protein [Chloroflexota bacterium]